MPDLLDDHFRFHQGALALRAQRQQTLASNIANADTPGYKARDIDFRSALEGALAAPGASGTTALAATDGRHLQAQGGAIDAPLLYRIPRQDSIDGSTVELDAERAAFTDNALRYEVGVQAVSGQVKDLLAVFQG